MLILRVDDDGKLARAAKALRDIEKSIPKGIRADLRDEFKTAESKAKGALGGDHLRPAIRSGTRAEHSGDMSTLISNKVDGYNLPAAVNASNKYMVDSYRRSYTSGWRHPVHGNRRAWVTQDSPSPGWFTDAVAPLPKSQAALASSQLGIAWTKRLEDAADYVVANT